MARLLGVLRAHVEHVALALQARCDQLVHRDVAPVELQAAHAVAQVGGPAQPVGAQVEQLQVAVVVAGREAALGVAVRVAEGERPALARLRRAPPSGRGPCAACGKPVSLAQCEAVSSVKACKLYDTTRLVISTCRAV